MADTTPTTNDHRAEARPDDDPGGGQMGTRRLFWLFALLGLMLILAELGFRAAGPALLPDPAEYAIPEIEAKVEQMDERRAQGLTGGIVLTGPSTAARLDPRPLTEGGVADVVYNAAIPGGSAAFQQEWLLEDVVPRLQPDMVIWAVGPYSLRRVANEELLADHLSSRAKRTGWLGSLERWAADRSAAAYYRPVVRGPATAFESVFGEDPWQPVYGPEGWRYRVEGAGAFSDPAETRVQQKFFETWRPSPSRQVAMQATIESLQDLGIEVVIVHLPSSDEARELVPRAGGVMTTARQMIEEVAAATDARYIDLEPGFTDPDLFVDLVHHTAEASRDQMNRLVVELGGRPAPPELAPTMAVFGPSEASAPVRSVRVSNGNRLIVQLDGDRLPESYVLSVKLTGGTGFGSINVDVRPELRVVRFLPENDPGQVIPVNSFVDGDTLELELPDEILSGEPSQLWLRVLPRSEGAEEMISMQVDFTELVAGSTVSVADRGWIDPASRDSEQIALDLIDSSLERDGSDLVWRPTAGLEGRGNVVISSSLRVTRLDTLIDERIVWNGSAQTVSVAATGAAIPATVVVSRDGPPEVTFALVDLVSAAGLGEAGPLAIGPSDLVDTAAGEVVYRGASLVVGE